jgi:hypothetical protein
MTVQEKPVKRKLIRSNKPVNNPVSNTTSLSLNKRKKKLIRKKKPTTIESQPIINKPLEVSNNNRDNNNDNNNNNNNDDNNNDEEVVVLVKPWKCSSNNIQYLLDPITQEVFDKMTHNYLGIRYKDQDELSLIDYS